MGPRPGCAIEKLRTRSDEFVAVEPPPPVLGGVEQLVGHRERGLLRAGALGDLGPELYGREARLDRVRCVLDGVKFNDGVKVTDDETTTTDEKVAA